MRLSAAFRRCLLIVAAAALTFGLAQVGAMRGADNFIAEKRMMLSQRPASGDIAYLAIDKRSLDRVGVWPWPRQIHASIIDKLVELDVAAIALDVDFSAASNPDADRALAGALEAAGGFVILPAFVQRNSADRDEEGFGETLPLPMLREHAWLGSANVAPDADGIVRRFPFNQRIGGEDLPSVPALLAGETGAPGTEIAINFALSPASVPVFSIDDLLEDRLPAAALQGKTVIIGAHAVELKDYFTVPVHGSISGAMIQILAAETIAQEIALASVNPLVVLAGLAVLLMLLSSSRRLARLRARVAAFACVAVALEVAGFLLLARYAVVLPTAGAHVLSLGVAVVFAMQELDLRHWLLRLARVEASNTQQVLEQIVNDSSDAVLVVREDSRIVEMSRYAQVLFGPASAGDGYGLLSDVLPPSLVEEVRQQIRELRAGLWQDTGTRELPIEVAGEERLLEYTVTPSRLELAQKRPAGGEGESFVACVTARDVTERRRQQARLDYLSRFDEMTGAMRRSEFLARLDRQLTEAGDGQVCVLVLNLHRFKTLNEILGRHVGDLILTSVVERLEGCDPRLSSVARLEGDTFALYTTTEIAPGEDDDIGRVLIELLNAPFEIEGTTARVGLHVGTATSDPNVRPAPNELLREAELALDETRKIGGDAFRRFDPATSAKQERKRRIEHALWTALERDEIYVAYQPQVRLSDLRLVGAEALIRWKHPQLGFVSPMDFIEVAEANGFVDELGRWMLNKVCEDAARWPADLTVAVNVSPVQFGRSDIIADVEQALARSGLPAPRLHLEITESVFLGPSTDFLEMLHDIRMLGVSLALDDFGSGFSSLGYLAHFPLDKIKVDRMFVQELGQDRANQAILKSVKILSNELGLKLICEGIETEDQLRHLRELGCDEGQGYLFGKPQPEAELLGMWTPLPPADALHRHA